MKNPKRILDVLPIFYNPVMWKDYQLLEAMKRYELFNGDDERYKKVIIELIQRKLEFEVIKV